MEIGILLKTTRENENTLKPTVDELRQVLLEVGVTVDEQPVSENMDMWEMHVMKDDKPRPVGFVAIEISPDLMFGGSQMGDVTPHQLELWITDNIIFEGLARSNFTELAIIKKCKNCGIGHAKSNYCIHCEKYYCTRCVRIATDEEHMRSGTYAGLVCPECKQFLNS